MRRSISPAPRPRPRESYNETLLKILASPNVASKEWIIRQYDHEVQGGSAIKPLVGVGEDGPGDASVVRPVLDSRKGVVVSCGMNPRLGDLDPYQSALHAVDEALRNAVVRRGEPRPHGHPRQLLLGQLQQARPHGLVRPVRQGLLRRGHGLRHAVRLRQGLAEQRVPDRRPARPSRSPRRC